MLLMEKLNAQMLVNVTGKLVCVIVLRDSWGQLAKEVSSDHFFALSSHNNNI